MRDGYRIIALHGFLGAASDWDVLRAAGLRSTRLDAPDLWELFGEATVTDWASIGDALSARLRAMLADDPTPAVLVAYSFGARLALAVPWLGGAESPLAGVCLVSCHPGFSASDDGAKAARKAADEAWARRFIEAPVATIWKEWDAQPVFAGTFVPPRENRLPGPRVTIARAIRLASLGTQPDRRAALRGFRRPLLWVSGARDAKFKAVAASVQAEGVPATYATCEHAGHRVAWDNPAEFARLFERWVEGLADARAS